MNQPEKQANHLFLYFSDLFFFPLLSDPKNVLAKLFQKHFKRLEKDCQKLLLLFLKKVPLKDIAEELGIGSQQYIKRKKYKCKEQLVRYIKSDPNYKEE